MSYTTLADETVSNRRTAIRDRALAALADADTDSETVKATVLRECYRQQPSVSFEDVLELNAVLGFARWIYHILVVEKSRKSSLLAGMREPLGRCSPLLES
jgi:hypothetical protein